ncbi:baculoviral IAP repeat-containing protein 3 [Biomphalaria pfeifferi]|uniref:Baculoviral IAP repeat-containing protein 3 n=1 Tax=Biomphalaria pfeifferi TaxID=112525 RepID=A0AAD8BA65_BIOPF|nr:baculoviral IAP repeat-containing protein 3 [Biomphalaria pfeifferi]
MSLIQSTIAPAGVSTEGNKRPSYSELAVATERPKNRTMVSKKARLQSFQKWSGKQEVKIEDLVSAGFYFTGHHDDDSTRCFACGGIVKDWEATDDAMVEHARHFPLCFFVRQAMGQDFIDTVKVLSEKDISNTRVILTKQSDCGLLTNDSQTKHQSDPAVQAVVDLGFDLDTVAKLALSLKTDSCTLTSDQLIDQLYDESTPSSSSDLKSLTSNNITHCTDSLEVLQSQNMELRQISTCKICLDQPVAIVFLPCGHFVTCLECSYELRKCPVCRGIIQGTVRGYLQSRITERL